MKKPVRYIKPRLNIGFLRHSQKQIFFSPSKTLLLFLYTWRQKKRPNTIVYDRKLFHAGDQVTLFYGFSHPENPRSHLLNQKSVTIRRHFWRFTAVSCLWLIRCIRLLISLSFIGFSFLCFLALFQ